MGSGLAKLNRDTTGNRGEKVCNVQHLNARIYFMDVILTGGISEEVRAPKLPYWRIYVKKVKKVYTCRFLVDILARRFVSVLPVDYWWIMIYWRVGL